MFDSAVIRRSSRAVFEEFRAEREALLKEYRDHRGDDRSAALMAAERAEDQATRYADRLIEEVVKSIGLNRDLRRAAGRELAALREVTFRRMLPGGKTAADVAAMFAATEEIDTEFADALAAIAEIPE